MRILILLLFVFHLVSPHTIVKTLPGYNGTLPFKLETGYIGVGESDQVQLFYYFIESENNPVKDPLLLWLTGGPGCSAFSGLVFEIGPLSFDLGASNGSFPSLILNEESWTKVANIIFLDSPVGSGFSYSTTDKGYYSSDSKTAYETYVFLQKWLSNHPRFINHTTYIAGDSYAGKLVPVITKHISTETRCCLPLECQVEYRVSANTIVELIWIRPLLGDFGIDFSTLSHLFRDNKSAIQVYHNNVFHEPGVKPHINLKGYLIGNPVANIHHDMNGRIPYAHQMALISDQYYKSAASSCSGEFINPDPNNKQCLEALQLIDLCLDVIRKPHILEPECLTEAPDGAEGFAGDILLPSQREESWCRDYNYLPVYAWANDPTVREALHIRKETKGLWLRCNDTLACEEDVTSSVPYHQYLTNRTYEALVYSGDHDMVIPYTATLKWIRLLNLTREETWRPWFVNGQIAGYTEKYKKGGFSLTFATVKGAGHTAPEYNPVECLSMITRWLSASAL